MAGPGAAIGISSSAGQAFRFCRFYSFLFFFFPNSRFHIRIEDLYKSCRITTDGPTLKQSSVSGDRTWKDVFGRKTSKANLK